MWIAISVRRGPAAPRKSLEKPALGVYLIRCNPQGFMYSTRNRAFTLVELLVVLGIIALLISLILPAFAKARRSATALNCASNMRQVGVAFSMYAAENKQTLPYALYQ